MHAVEPPPATTWRPPLDVIPRLEASGPSPPSFPLLSCFLSLSPVVDRAPPWSTAVELAASELQSPPHLVLRVKRRRIRRSPPPIEAEDGLKRRQRHRNRHGRRGLHLQIRRPCYSNGLPEPLIVIRVRFPFFSLLSFSLSCFVAPTHRSPCTAAVRRRRRR